MMLLSQCQIRFRDVVTFVWIGYNCVGAAAVMRVSVDCTGWLVRGFVCVCGGGDHKLAWRD